MTLIVPVTIGALAVICSVWYAWGDAQRTSTAHWVFLFAAGTCLTAAGFLTFWFAAMGGVGGILSFLILSATTLLILPSGLTLFLRLRPSRRWLPLLVAFLTPFLLWGLMNAGDSHSPENRVIQHAEVVIGAVEAYRVATGRYPETTARHRTGYW